MGQHMAHNYPSDARSSLLPSPEPAAKVISTDPDGLSYCTDPCPDGDISVVEAVPFLHAPWLFSFS
jgi:hypothetical protein